MEVAYRNRGIDSAEHLRMRGVKFTGHRRRTVFAGVTAGSPRNRIVQMDERMRQRLLLGEQQQQSEYELHINTHRQQSV